MNILCLSFTAVALLAISQWERVAGGPTSLAGERFGEDPPASQSIARLCCSCMTVSINRKDTRLFDERIDEHAMRSDQCKTL